MRFIKVIILYQNIHNTANKVTFMKGVWADCTEGALPVSLPSPAECGVNALSIKMG
jgi:hypothetical protein